MIYLLLLSRYLAQALVGCCFDVHTFVGDGNIRTPYVWERSFCKVCILHTETMVHDDLSALLFPILNLPLMLAKGQSEYISSIIGTLYKCTNVLNWSCTKEHSLTFKDTRQNIKIFSMRRYNYIFNIILTRVAVPRLQ